MKLRMLQNALSVLRIKLNLSCLRISIGYSMICSDIWHKYHE